MVSRRGVRDIAQRWRRLGRAAIETSVVVGILDRASRWPRSNRVLETSVLSIGPWVERFEEAVARRAGVPHAAAVSSGTAGLHMCLIAAGVDAGDLVVTTPFSFVASANVILYERAVPVFVDCCPETYNVRASDIEPELNERTKAVIPVHLFGQCCDLDPILDLAERHGVSVIEDAAQAIGAESKGRRAGSMVRPCVPASVSWPTASWAASSWVTALIWTSYSYTTAGASSSIPMVKNSSITPAFSPKWRNGCCIF